MAHRLNVVAIQELQSRGEGQPAKCWGVERERLALVQEYVVLQVRLTRLFHLKESILMEAGLLQKHFPSQNTNGAEKTSAGGVITTKNPILLLMYCF